MIIIGHSFGGILAKKVCTEVCHFPSVDSNLQALVTANEAPEGSRSSHIAAKTMGFLFMGTPHRGSNFALFATLSSYFSYWRGSRSELLEFLTPSSRELDDLHHSFLQGFNHAYICNFFETVPIKFKSIPMYPVSWHPTFHEHRVISVVRRSSRRSLL